MTNPAKRPLRWLTAIFTASAVMVTSLPPVQAQDLAIANNNDTATVPQAPVPVPLPLPYTTPDPAGVDNMCIGDINAQNIEALTGFHDLTALQQASALITQMNGENGTPAAVLAILEASDATGVSFELMAAKAIIESRLGVFNQPIAVNGSARGVYQFMPATWLIVFNRWAGQYQDGRYAALAQAVEYDAKGAPYVRDKDVETQILALRSDPYIASFLKAMQMREEEEPVLRTILHRAPKPVDYYMVHFLGLPRARLFYRNLSRTPDSIARYTFAREARYNHGVFYNSRNRSRTYRQVYEHLGALMDNYIRLVRERTEDGMKNQDCIKPLVRGQTPPPPAPLPEVDPTPALPEDDTDALPPLPVPPAPTLQP